MGCGSSQEQVVHEQKLLVSMKSGVKSRGKIENQAEHNESTTGHKGTKVIGDAVMAREWCPHCQHLASRCTCGYCKSDSKGNIKKKKKSTESEEDHSHSHNPSHTGDSDRGAHEGSSPAPGYSPTGALEAAELSHGQTPHTTSNKSVKSNSSTKSRKHGKHGHHHHHGGQKASGDADASAMKWTFE